MNTLKFALCALMTLMLSGCLEVEQHPAYADGGYAGKRDNRSDEAKFHNDKLAQTAALNDRAQNQNEYNRTHAH
jgi:hypothetical protein